MTDATDLLQQIQGHGIAVAVWPWNIWYQGVTLDDVDEILERTVMGAGGVVEALRMPDVPWE